MTTTPAAIVHVTTYLHGGAGQIVTDLATSQQACGCRVVVVASEAPCDEYTNEEGALQALSAGGVRLLTVDTLLSRRSDDLVQAVDRLAAALALDTIDVCHAHAAFPSLLALTLRGVGAHRAIVVQTMHGWGIRKTSDQASMDVRIMNRLDQVVTLSQAGRARLLDIGVTASNVSVVPNGIAAVWNRHLPDSVHVARIRRERALGRTVVCCVGHVGPRKNQVLLLRALAELPSEDRPLVVCVGGGDLTEVAAEAERLGVASDLCLTGYSPNACAFFEVVDWCALPSRDEGLPISVLEAFRAGVPVLASDIPELGGLVCDGENGIVFRSDDVGACAHAMRRACRLSAAERAAAGSAGRQRWAAEHRLETMCARYLALYDEVRARRRTL